MVFNTLQLQIRDVESYATPLLQSCDQRIPLEGSLLCCDEVWLQVELKNVHPPKLLATILLGHPSAKAVPKCIIIN